MICRRPDRRKDAFALSYTDVHPNSLHQDSKKQRKKHSNK